MNLDFNCSACDEEVLHQTWVNGKVVDPCTGWLGDTTVVVEPWNILAAKRWREDLLRDNPFEDRIIGAELFDDPKPGHVEQPCYHVKYSDSTPCRECIALAEPVPLYQESEGGRHVMVDVESSGPLPFENILKARQAAREAGPVEQADGVGECGLTGCDCSGGQDIGPMPDSGRKEDHKQEKYSLIKQEFLAELARVMDYGANTKSYGRGNWEKGFAWSKSYDAMLRHIEAFRAGERFDSDSDFHPLAHAAAHLMFLFTYSNDEQYAHFDDL